VAHFPTLLSVVITTVLCSAQIALAETRGEAVLKPAGDTRIVDLPAGHWATNATQVVIANNIITLDDGAFQGDRLLTADELKQAMDTLASTAEAIAAKGANTKLRAAIGNVETGNGPITRLRLAQTLSRFLDACASQELVAIAAANHDASRFKDVGASVPPAVSTVVDKFKVMTGYPDNTFRPDGEVTRYQMAAISYNVLNTMRMAPLAQLPVAAPTQAAGPTYIVVQPPTPEASEPTLIVPAGPLTRLNFRERAPLHVSWQAVNNTNVSTGAPFASIPISGMFTAYNGPLMLQNVTDVRVNVYQTNQVDTEFRAGYSGFKYGMFQAIPYVGAHLGLGTSAPAAGSVQYDSYVGASYGAILSVTPNDVLEFHATAGQTQLLSAGRFNSSFQPQAYPNALGSVLTNYGVGADFYVAPNIALTLGFNNWQNPASLASGNQTNATGIINTMGANLGIGSKF
jgi:hypothetical protein